MIKSLAITPPILGRISIGKIVEKNGKRIPEKDDQFTITSQIQSKDGWVKHPMNETLRAKAGNNKLRSIPVRMIFNDPELNIRAEYTLFDRQTGRPVCIGNGETCQRSGQKHHAKLSNSNLLRGFNFKRWNSLQDAIIAAKEIDQQSKQAGFYQEALDMVAKQGYANAKLEMEGEEGLDVVDEFYNSDEQQPQPQKDTFHSSVTSLQKGLAQSVKTVN